MRSVALLAVVALLALGPAACGSQEEVAFPEDEQSEADAQRQPGSPPDDTGGSADDGSPSDEDAEDADEGGGGSEPTDASGSADDGGDTPTGLIAQPSTQRVQSGDFPTGGGELARLVDVRVGVHQGFDRVVLEFEGSDVPSYRVGYVEPPVRQDGSGHVVEVAGDAFLEMRLTPASGRGPDMNVTYEGPSRISASGAGAVTEVVRTGDFEANLAWVAGVDQRRPFAVRFLKDPLRLVVDVVSG